MAVEKKKFQLPVLETKEAREVEMDERMKRMEQALAALAPSVDTNATSK